MDIEPNLEELRKRHELATGRPFSHFMCPITLRDEEVPLQRGHILNDALKFASKKRILQRRDVDQFYGAYLEPDFIKYMNADVLTLPEAIMKGRTFEVTLPNGTKCQALPLAAKGAGSRFPSLPIHDEDGETVATVFLKTHPDNIAGLKGLHVDFRLRVSEPAVVGSWIKSAYLAVFRRIGYPYAYSRAGEYVRCSLSGFFLAKGTRESAGTFFDRFKGCNHFLGGGEIPKDWDTVGHETAFVHVADGVAYGLSLLFRVNKLTHMVTVPLQEDGANWFSVIKRYDAALRAPAMLRRPLPVRLAPNGIHRIGNELSLGFVDDVGALQEMRDRELSR